MKHTTKYILDKLTDEQKASLLCGAGFFSTREIKEAAIRRLQFLDGGTGMNFEQLFGDIFIAYAIENGYTREQFDHVIHNFYKLDNLTDEEKKLRDELFEKLTRYTGGFEPHPGCYPPGILLGSTWNPEVVYENGQALGLEARMYKVSCLLGTPNVNLLREPRNGRFFEGYSEDPLVGGLLGREMVKGVESQQVASDVKHFAANNLEINRSGIDQRISRRALEEMYLPAFEKCVKAGAATVMAAYPKINGEHCTENPWLLREVLKERWGFEGLCMTDWGACVGDSGDSVASGIDLLMPGPWNKEEEILAAKIRIHDEVGRSLLAFRAYLSGHGSREALTQMWRRTTALLKREAESGDEGNPFTALTEAAESVGVRLDIIGRMPEDKTAESIIATAVHECLTNTVRHGGGDTLTVRMTSDGDIITVELANNGRLPEKPIAETGGLKALRDTVEMHGGTMAVSCDGGVFALTVKLQKEMVIFE